MSPWNGNGIGPVSKKQVAPKRVVSEILFFNAEGLVDWLAVEAAQRTKKKEIRFLDP